MTSHQINCYPSIKSYISVCHQVNLSIFWSLPTYLLISLKVGTYITTSALVNSFKEKSFARYTKEVVEGNIIATPLLFLIRYSSSVQHLPGGSSRAQIKGKPATMRIWIKSFILRDKNDVAPAFFLHISFFFFI